MRRPASDVLRQEQNGEPTPTTLVHEGGLEISELAAQFGISEATVSREWRSAREWLAVEVRRYLPRYYLLLVAED